MNFRAHFTITNTTHWYSETNMVCMLDAHCRNRNIYSQSSLRSIQYTTLVH